MSDGDVMECQRASEFVSALYDGERVPTAFADHISACPDCRSRLREYSEMGAELRLLASRAPGETALPQALREKALTHRSRFAFVRAAVLVPRYAVAGVAGLLFVAAVGLLRLEAQQNRPLWLQYEIAPQGREGSLTLRGAVKAGYDDYAGIWSVKDGFVGIHLAVSKIEDNSVEISLRSRVYPHAKNTDEVDLKKDLGDLTGHKAVFQGGKRLEIPLEGGGTLVVRGEILDHQPRFLFGGIPLEPSPDQLVLSSPVLISGDKVLFNFKGGNAVASGADEAVVFLVPGTGLLKFALRPFPGAIKSEAAWGRLDFQLDGRSYSLLTVSQVSGGDQPHAVWIKNDPHFSRSEKGLMQGFVSVDRLSAPVW